jgi:hypothetical protein
MVTHKCSCHVQCIFASTLSQHLNKAKKKKILKHRNDTGMLNSGLSIVLWLQSFLTNFLLTNNSHTAYWVILIGTYLCPVWYEHTICFCSLHITPSPKHASSSYVSHTTAGLSPPIILAFNQTQRHILTLSHLTTMTGSQSSTEWSWLPPTPKNKN